MERELGKRTVPVEKAIPSEQKSVDLEHLSHWLDKYDGKYALGACSCRRSRRVRDEGCGHLEDDMCIAVGDMATYAIEANKARPATREEVMEILQRAEENGFVHQITNIDGKDKILGICNCCVCSCYALRTSQLFNMPNMSASAYRAHVDPEKCVACGQCAKVCPAGAAKLGQKLCTKEGPIVYPKQVLPDETKWGPEMWNENYRDDNPSANCYDTGTAPCKSNCPAHIAVQGYIRMVAEGRYMDALKLIKKENPFPAVCGHICNRRCEQACTRGSIDRAVAIDEIKKFIAEQELHADKRYVPKMLNQRNIPFTEKVAATRAARSRKSRSKRRRPAASAAACARPDASLTPSTWPRSPGSDQDDPLRGQDESHSPLHGQACCQDQGQGTAQQTQQKPLFITDASPPMPEKASAGISL